MKKKYIHTRWMMGYMGWMLLAVFDEKWKKHLCNEGERKDLGCREKLDKESIFEE